MRAGSFAMTLLPGALFNNALLAEPPFESYNDGGA